MDRPSDAADTDSLGGPSDLLGARRAPPNLSASRGARRFLKATMTSCSWDAGWRSLLLRAYIDPPEVEELVIPANVDPVLVLVTGGWCNVEARRAGKFQRAEYRAGSLAMRSAGEGVALRWRSDSPHSTLHLHLPTSTFRSVAEAMARRRIDLPSLPSQLLCEDDPVVSRIILGLAQATATGVPDLYAETAGDFLVAHLLVQHCRLNLAPVRAELDDRRLRRVEAYMRANLPASVSLQSLADEACMSRYHFVRMFKRAYGETPFKRFTRLRIEEAQRLLANSGATVTEIARACGYDNPAHFATAFRREVGVAPRDYRDALR